MLSEKKKEKRERMGEKAQKRKEKEAKEKVKMKRKEKKSRRQMLKRRGEKNLLLRSQPELLKGRKWLLRTEVRPQLTKGARA